jgi:hypothetical protein
LPRSEQHQSKIEDTTNKVEKRISINDKKLSEFRVKQILKDQNVYTRLESLKGAGEKVFTT